jgi:CheY-like chemotaxis protein
MAPLFGLRVLVVDDQQTMRYVVTYLLEINGAKVQSCESADQALDTCVRWKPDVIVSDIQMPEHDGYWFLEHVRQLEPEQGRETPAIALTSLTDDGSKFTWLNQLCMMISSVQSKLWPINRGGIGSPGLTPAPARSAPHPGAGHPSYGFAEDILCMCCMQAKTICLAPYKAICTG